MKTNHPHYGFLLLCGLVLLSGCRTPPDPEAVEANLAPGMRKPAPSKVMLIETPRRMREDIKYPDSTKMGFFWSEQSAEWRFKLLSGHYSHVGFRFLVPHNLAVQRDDFELIFNIAPATMTRYLWIGLVDGVDHPHHVLVDLPMSHYAPNAKGTGFVEVRIPLRDFSSIGSIVAKDTETDVEIPDAPFDWVDVAELRIIHNGGRLPNRETIITDMRFER